MNITKFNNRVSNMRLQVNYVVTIQTEFTANKVDQPTHSGSVILRFPFIKYISKIAENCTRHISWYAKHIIGHSVSSAEN